MDSVGDLYLYHTDAECSGTPYYAWAGANLACDSGRADGSCQPAQLGNLSAYATYTCSSDKHADIATAFGSQAFVGYDNFDDTGCVNYKSTLAFPATTDCIVRSPNWSVWVQLFAGGSAELHFFYESEDCSSADTKYSVQASTIEAQTCFQSPDSVSYAYFTSESLAANSGSESAASSSESAASSSESAASSSESEASSSESAASNFKRASSSSESAASSSSVESAAPTSTSDLSTGAIIGIAAAAVAVVVVAAVAFWFCRRKRRYKDVVYEDALLQDDTYTTGKGSSDAIPTIGSSQPSNPSSWMPAYPNSEGGSALWEDDVIVSSRVPKDKVVLGALLSRGGFGEVYQGTYNGQEVAVKMLLPETRRSLKHVNAFLAEVKMMAALEHTHIVRFVGVAWDSLNDLCVLSEYMHGGDLRALLSRYEASSHPQGFDHAKVKIALHIAHALTYLHSLLEPVIHRDLKSKNVLLTRELDAKLTDFGVSREREDGTMTAGVGTSLWMAPEVMMGERYDEAADMFSFGVMLSELDVHSLPYSHAKMSSNTSHKLPDAAILQMVAMGTLRVEFSAGALPEMVALGVACVSIDPKERPTAPEVLHKLHTVLRTLRQA